MIDSEIFGQNQALEKPPRGKPVRERERFYYASGKNQTFIYSQKPTYLNPVKWLSKLPRFLCKCCLVFHASPSWKTCLKNLARSALNFCAKQQLMLPSISVQTVTKIRIVRTAINVVVRPLNPCHRNTVCCLDKCAWNLPRNQCQIRTVRPAINVAVLLKICAHNKCCCTPRFLCLWFNEGRTPWNLCQQISPQFPCQLKISLSWCLENRAHSPSSALSSSFSSQKWKVKWFASLNPFCLNPKWESNPTVEKDPIQWLRFNESKNHIYLNHLNKFTHPLKFIKKWL